MADRDQLDHWIVLAALGTSGHGSEHHRHPTDGQLLLQVGEGQDGVALFSGEIADNRIRLVQYPWNDRCLIAVAPNGNQFMTVNHGQENVAFHSDPNGEVTLEFPISAFGHDPAESAIY